MRVDNTTASNANAVLSYVGKATAIFFLSDENFVFRKALTPAIMWLNVIVAGACATVAVAHGNAKGGAHACSPSTTCAGWLYDQHLKSANLSSNATDFDAVTKYAQETVDAAGNCKFGHTAANAPYVLAHTTNTPPPEISIFVHFGREHWHPQAYPALYTTNTSYYLEVHIW